MAQAGPIDQRGFLAGLELFSGLPPDRIDRLSGLASRRQLEPHRELFHKGDEGGALYGVLSGRLKATDASEDGKELVFEVMGPGEVIGEIALLDAGPRSATVVAMEHCELLVLERRDLLAFMRAHPDAAIHLCQVMAARVRRLSDTLADAYFRNLPARLSRKLLSLARVHGRETPEGLCIELKLSQQELGELVGKTREAVNKQMRTWTEAGVLSTRSGVITLHSIEALETAAGDPDW